MNKTFQSLQLSQLDSTLQVWRNAHLPPRPGGGWVRAIRESLGMSATALAKRLGMTHAGVARLERSEAQDAITLASLKKLANALDCELQYALVPRNSLQAQLQAQAVQVARERIAPVSHSMSLEAQSVQGASKDRQVQLLAQELLQGSRRELW